jgi:hypothetical protein
MTPEQEETFLNLWEAAQAICREYYHDFRQLAQDIRPNMTDSQFDRGWQFCNCTHPVFKQAGRTS